jgi:hypothetical protein
MDKKQYFWLWWALASLTPVISVVLVLTGIISVGLAVSPIMLLILCIWAISFDGFILTMGLHFAQKIGAHLLFLNGHYNCKKDILMPALVMGVVAACTGLAINAVVPVTTIRLFFDAPSYDFLYQALPNIFSAFGYGIFVLLFSVAGFALLIKKVTKNASLSILMPVSIILVTFLRNVVPLIWTFGTAVAVVDPYINCAVACSIDVLLGMLFWKKGFEIAVLCHLVMSFIFYIVAPIIIIAVGS